jgi:hypothetical protein
VSTRNLSQLLSPQFWGTTSVLKGDTRSTATVSSPTFKMQIHFITLFWLLLALFSTPIVAVSESPTTENDCASRLTNAERAAVTTTAIYTVGSSVFILSACQLVTNRVEIPILASSSSSPYFPLTSCFALGTVVGAVTGTVHVRYTYTEGVWNWIWDRVGEIWLEL